MRRFTRTIRTRDWLELRKQERNKVLEDTLAEDNYNPKIYINSDWEPPPASTAIETSLRDFTNDLKTLCTTYYAIERLEKYE